MLTSRSGAWAPGRARGWAFVLLGLVGAALTVRQIRHAAGTPAIDFVHVWRAAHQMWTGQGAYRDPLFSYPPSAALLLAPIGALGYATARIGMLVVNVAAVMTAAFLLVRQLRGRVDSWVIVAMTCAGAFDAVASTWANGNINGPLILLEVVALRQFLRGRWTSGGVALGVSLALKPVLLPMVALLAVRRQWRGLSVAIAIPAVPLAIGSLTIPDAHRYLSVVLPYLLHGAQLDYNDSLVGVGSRLGVGAAFVFIARLALFTAAAAIYLRARFVGARLDDRSMIFAEAGLAISVTLLVSPLSETYYTLFLLPSAIWWAMRGRRNAIAAAVVGIACFGTLRLPGTPGDIHHSWSLLAIRPTLGWFLLLCCFATALSSRRRPEPSTLGVGIRRPAPPPARAGVLSTSSAGS